MTEEAASCCGRGEIKCEGQQDTRKWILQPKNTDGGPQPRALQHPRAPQQDDAKILCAEQKATGSWSTGSSSDDEILEEPALQSSRFSREAPCLPAAYLGSCEIARQGTVFKTQP